MRRAAIAFDGVERAEESGPPTAFRIWRAGENTTDHGPTVFSERSAALLTEQQARRGNRFSIDVNHLSLDKTAPLENQRAVGWFDIEVRDGELWAVNVEWTDTVRGGLSKEPPEWRYHSPAYDVDTSTGEVLSLVNLAITNCPATWGVTALASRGAKVAKMADKRMTWGDIKAALDGDDENKKAAAYAAIMAAFPDEGEPEKSAEEPNGDEPEKKDEEDMPEKKDAAEHEEPDGDEKAAKATIASLAATVARLESRLAAQEKEKAAEERKALLASLSPELSAVLATAPMSIVRDAVKKLPKRAAKGSTEHVQATRGAGQTDANAPRSTPEEQAELDRRMGLGSGKPAIERHADSVTYRPMTPSEAAAYLAKTAKEVK